MCNSQQVTYCEWVWVVTNRHSMIPSGRRLSTGLQVVHKQEGAWNLSGVLLITVCLCGRAELSWGRLYLTASGTICGGIACAFLREIQWRSIGTIQTVWTVNYWSGTWVGVEQTTHCKIIFNAPSSIYMSSASICTESDHNGGVDWRTVTSLCEQST